MTRTQTLLALTLAGAIAAGAAGAADKPVKIGMITTLSGGGAALGVDARDAFQLALDLKGGKFGGVPTELLVADDAQKVENAKQIATRFLKQDDVDVVTGIVWSNLAIAVVPTVTRAGKIYVSTNAGPSILAGKGCDANYFNAAYQNDNLHEAVGQYVTDKGLKRLYLLAPNYPAGKDSITGFKRFFKGEVVAEVYTTLGQVDYAAEIANLRAAKPEGVFFFLPGGMGVNFVKQYAQAGLINEIPLFGPGFSFDEGILSAVGEAAVGAFNSSEYTWDLDNAANKAFVEAFRQKYGRKPSLYAAQAFDAALLIDSAVAAVKGDMTQSDAVRAALKKADFPSVRGNFKFGPNNHPIQDIYIRQVVKEGDTVTNKTIGKVFTDHQDAYAAECRM
ncbi:MAG: ABC transporter substrate-binding protein [Rhodospirillales bacterium]|jgi:branched-chain amino acid transport system substrate-binding protein|nr:ABC transporter substrate-binding protein [Rhodospirillales bacterium]